MTWRQHTEPFVEYNFLANIIGDRIIGEIVKPNKSKSKKKLSIKEKIELVWIIILLLGVIIGIPFLISLLISDNVLLSIIIGLIPLVILITMSFIEKGNIPIHRQNIIEMIHRIE